MAKPSTRSGSGSAADAPPRYRGRFAPSPTGLLHLGSLVAALGSFLDARSRGGEWLVRIEDLDPLRTVSGVADAILSALDACGLHWDGSVHYQSQRTAAYAAALDRLIEQGLAYPCACSRKEIAAHGLAGIEGPVYPGTCRAGLPPGRTARAWRVGTDNDEVAFVDRVQGHRAQRIATAVGDFVVRRADGVHAYQLAVVVDDAWQGITDIVRGADLIASTPRQIHLQHLLGAPSPRYAHLPLVLDATGRKLSKSDAAHPLDPRDPLPALLRAWRFLGQPPLETAPANPAEFLEMATRVWAIERAAHQDRRRIAARQAE
ncbi:tRNA glutamyl-Q(34) synthetase GluQRS [Thioalkalicoccus limnaeus]|uniref:Glutamyl-Q tRNA(Asp) synthetase n=1 Tax=Thioalkalicoccus limnaeus TaxID=120681 RepID=A0ABV4BFW2_9GAMM